MIKKANDMTMLIRPITQNDIDQLAQLASQAGVGLTNLPNDRSVLMQKINRSKNSFAKTISAPEEELYFFVLEDTSEQKIIGTCAIESRVGITTPFYSYKRVYRDHVSSQLNIHKTLAELHLVNDYRDVTEICSLMLLREYRKHQLGPLLSRSRFLFIAQFPERFSKTIIAEMRGVINSEGHSPFWRSLGKKFFDIDFSLADYLTATQNKQFIADLMPKHPIYVALLRKSAQRAIGQPHRSTQPAMKMLEQEGFVFADYVDIFDAGPTVQATTENIHSVKRSTQARIVALAAQLKGPNYLIANTALNFRATQASLQTNPDNTVVLRPDTAALLNVAVGDTIRFVLR